jgi:hypothetical protein
MARQPIAQPVKSEHLVAAFERMKEVLVRRKKDRSYNINRIVSSIQWCYDNMEQPGSTGPTFVMPSNIVKAAIEQQQENWKNCGSLMHLGSDPHKGLKDLMPLADKLKIGQSIHNGSRGD